MIYLSGVTNDSDEPALIEHQIGLMLNPGNSYHRRAERYPFWAADNGCFNAKWVEGPWLEWLAFKVPTVRCLFATAPDVYPDATATLARSAGYFDVIRELGFPVALVAQNGAENMALPWDDFDALFLGGEAVTPEWKTSAAAERLVDEARSHGKWVHMGRVNSAKRLKRAKEMGCHSADGTYLKYRRRDERLDGVTEIGLWTVTVESEPMLWASETPSLPVHRDALALKGWAA